MRVSKEFKEVLFRKITEFSNKAQKQIFNHDVEKITDALFDSYKEKVKDFKEKCAQEAIKEVERKYKHHFQDKYIDEIKQKLKNDSSWRMNLLCASTEHELALQTCSKIQEAAEKEKQDLILKLPFLKKEEELKEYMKGIEDRLNAI